MRENVVMEDVYVRQSHTSEAFPMDKEKKRLSPLAEVELEALGAGREWMRQRVQKNLQKLADEQGDISPPKQLADDSISPDKDNGDDKRRQS